MNSASFTLIGGGVMRNNETVAIDKYLIDKSKRVNGKPPQVLFFSTGSNDLPAYIDDFSNRYISYGADVEILKLCGMKISSNQIHSKLKSVDLIYVGGGDPELIVRKFREYEVDKVLKSEIKKNQGLIIAGLSAGAAVLCSHYYNFDIKGGKYENTKINKGLGLIDYTFFAHFEPSGEKIIKTTSGENKLNNHPVLSVSNSAAAILEDGKIYSISDNNLSGAYVYNINGNEVHAKELPHQVL